MTVDATRTLIESAALGDRQAIEALLEKYLPGLRAFVRLRCGAELRAKESTSDIVQSVCRELLQGLATFRWQGEACFKSWLFSAALRKVADRAEYFQAAKRDAGRELSLERGSRSDASLWACYQSLSSPSQHAIAREQAERIERAFEQLSDEQREVVVLAKIAGLSRTEIGKHLGKSEGAVRAILHRALAELSDRLAEAHG
ncbi:MAG: sigma-70 family RNA polymerase sigma factor [Planctomycetota bacterium]